MTMHVLGDMPTTSCAGPERPLSPDRRQARAAAVLETGALLQRIRADSAARLALHKRAMARED